MRIAAVTITGWAAIVAVAWKLANARIALCYMTETECIVRTTAARDNVLIAGMVVALVIAVALIAKPFALRRSKPNGSSYEVSSSTNRAELPRLR